MDRNMEDRERGPPLPGLSRRGRILFLLGVGAVLTPLLAAFDFGAEGRSGPVTPVEEAQAPSFLPEANREVERWVARFLSDQRPAFERYLHREGLYSGMIRERLRQRGMPEELIYLAAIESEFTPRAVSRAEAGGMWQFMGPTAQDFGLRMDDYVDERRDPVRATEAALDYLMSLHDQFGSWYLAAAAYNAGPGRVARALEAHLGKGAGKAADFWEIRERLPPETREYVPKMLAAALLARDAEAHGFEVTRAQPLHFDPVWVPGGTSLSALARTTGMPLARIRELNPHLLLGAAPPGGFYEVRVPPGEGHRVVASLGNRWRRLALDD